MIKTESLYSLCSVYAHEIDWYDDYSEVQPNKFWYTALEFDISFQRDLSAYETSTNYHQFKCLVVFVRNQGLGFENTDRSYSFNLVNVPIDRVFMGTDLEQIDLDYILGFYPDQSVSSTKHYGYALNDTLTLNVGDRYFPPNRSGFFVVQKIIKGYDLRYPFRLSLDLYNNQSSQEFLIRNEIKRCCLKCESDYVYRVYDIYDLMLSKSFLRTLPNSNYYVYDPDFKVVVETMNEYAISHLYFSRLSLTIRGLQHTYSMFLTSTVPYTEFRDFVRVYYSLESGSADSVIISEKPDFVYESSEKVYCDHPNILSIILSHFQTLYSNMNFSISHNSNVNESPFCIYDPNFGDWMVPLENPYKV